MRVYELARELGVASRDILAALGEMGVEGRTASSSVPPEAVPRLRASVDPPATAPRPEAAVAVAEPVTQRSPGPWLGPPPALRRTRAARAARTPLFRTRQDRVMAVAALLLFVGTFSTFALLGPDPDEPAPRGSHRVVMPVLELESSSPTGETLAVPGASLSAEPSPSPSPKLGLRLSRGVGVATAGLATTPAPETAAAQGTNPGSNPGTNPGSNPGPNQGPPPTVRPSQTPPPPEPEPSPTEPEPSPTEPEPSPTEPSPSPSDDDDDDDKTCWPPAPPHCP